MGIFADVLFQTLSDHQRDDYSNLGGGPARGDPVWHLLRLVAVPSQVIQRLKMATHAPQRAATLNAALLEETARRLRFSDEEKLRLRAALLAQGAEVFLRDRMTPEEQPIINQITGVLYAELRGRLQKFTGGVRSGESLLEGLELALTFLERAGEMSDAATAAAAAGDHAMAIFWFKLARKAYEQALPLLRSHDPAFADEIARLIQSLPE